MAIDTQSDYAALACSVRGVKLSGALQPSELLQAQKLFTAPHPEHLIPPHGRLTISISCMDEFGGDMVTYLQNK
jgi:hypothetical protein